MLRICGMIVCIFGLVPFAKADFIRGSFADASALNQLVGRIQKVIGSGKYTGVTSAGDVCRVPIDYSNDANHPDIYLRGAQGGYLKIFPTGGDYVNYLFGNTETEGREQVQFIGEIDQAETQAHALYVNIVGKNGNPSSVQIGLPHGTHGGGRPFQTGDVVPTSHITMFPACNGLVSF